jgi:hypothetical protein
MKEIIKCLTPAVLEGISKILGDTGSGLTGNISEQDALEILGMISYCHRRLDKNE